MTRRRPVSHSRAYQTRCKLHLQVTAAAQLSSRWATWGYTCRWALLQLQLARSASVMSVMCFLCYVNI